MSVLLDHAAHRDRARGADSAIYEIDDAASFLRQQPAVALMIARMLAQRLNVATTYLADLKRQYGGHGNHLAMVGDHPAEHDQPSADTGFARLGSAIRSKDVSQGGAVWIVAAGRVSGALRSIDWASSAASQNALPRRDRARCRPAGGRAAGRY